MGDTFKRQKAEIAKKTMLGEKGKKIATTPVIKNMIDRTPNRPFVSISKTHCRLYLKHRELIEIFEQEKISSKRLMLGCDLRSAACFNVKDRDLLRRNLSLVFYWQ